MRSRNNDVFATSFPTVAPASRQSIAVQNKGPQDCTYRKRTKSQKARQSWQSRANRFHIELPSELLDFLNPQNTPDDQDTFDLRLPLASSYLLGRGKTSNVYLASYRRPLDHKWTLCAAKRVHDNDEAKQEALSEVMVLADVGAHPNIIKLMGIVREDTPEVSILDSGVRHRSSWASFESINDEANARTPSLSASRSSRLDSERLVLVQELCPRGTLLSYVGRNGHTIGRAVWLTWAKQLVNAVVHCHEQGFLHGDIKPQNVMLCDARMLKLCDFGSAVPLDKSFESLADRIIGTTAYSAPERLERQFLSPATDCFSLGITLHFCITGTEPFEQCKSPVETILQVSKGQYWNWMQHRKNSESISPVSSSSRPSSLCSFQSTASEFDPPSITLSSVSRSSSRRSFTKANVALLLREDESDSIDMDDTNLPESSMPSDDEDLIHRSKGTSSASSLKINTARANTGSIKRPPNGLQSYSDGSVLQYFLSGDVVPEGILQLLQKMTAPSPSMRPSLRQVKQMLDVF